MKKNTILLTGANGNIGSKIAEKLISKGYRIIGIDLTDSNFRGLYNNASYVFYKADITQVHTLPREITQAEILIHCAALVHRSSKDLSKENYFRINHQGTKNILSFLDKTKLKQIIFLSTVSVYGGLTGEVVPDENTPPAPEDFYGESKVAAEDEIRDFSKINRIPFTILRLAPVYGENFLLNINKRVYLPKKIAFYKIASGKQRISLCSVHNVVDMIAYSINRNNYFNEIFIVKDKEDYSVNEIICVLRQAFVQKYKPIIRIPLFLPKIFLGCIALIMPKKGKFYEYQLKKIAQDSIYSGTKVYSSGIQLKWNLENTLSNVVEVS